MTEINEINDHRLISSLSNVPVDEVSIHQDRLTALGYKNHVIVTNEGRAEILYFQRLTEEVITILNLRARDLGIEDPPLSLNEHTKLGRAYGISEDGLDQFRSAMLLYMKNEGIGDHSVQIKSIPILRLMAPTSFRETATEWAARANENFGFNVVHSGPVYLEVRPKDGVEINDLKTRLDECNIYFTEIVQE